MTITINNDDMAANDDDYANANDFFIGHMVPLPSLQGPLHRGPLQAVVLSQVPHCDLRLQHLLLWR